MGITAKELSAEIARKPLVNSELRDLYWAEGDNGGFILDGKRLPLARMTAEDLATREAAATYAAFGEAPHWVAGRPDQVPADRRIDHLDRQTPVKDQCDRLTCASFATVAAMESILKGRGEEAILSEQYAGFVAHGGNQCLDATEISEMAAALERNPICPEALDRYEDRVTVTLHCKQQPSPEALQQAKYSIDEHQDIANIGLSGPSVANTDYLEALLAQGHDIVVEIEAAFDPAGAGVQDVQFDPVKGDAVRTGRKHALLIVGYDRGGATSYFICKNSFGPKCGYQGYYLFSYHYINTYAIRGVIVGSVRTKEP